MHNDSMPPKTIRLRRSAGMIDLTPAPLVLPRPRGRARRSRALSALLHFLADPRLAWALTGAIAAFAALSLVIIWKY